jgi:hypothetical protein
MTSTNQRERLPSRSWLVWRMLSTCHGVVVAVEIPSTSDYTKQAMMRNHGTVLDP